MNDNHFITRKEKESLEKELQNLKEVERVKVIEQLRIARAYGDLSENSEYENARKQQAALETRISEIESNLKTATVLREDHHVEIVTIGNTVTVDIKGEGKKTFNIGTEGNDIMISPHSPIAEGLLGKKVGDVVVIHLPKGETEMKVLKIKS